jgi:hypothetical protein
MMMGSSLRVVKARDCGGGAVADWCPELLDAVHDSRKVEHASPFGRSTRAANVNFATATLNC